ncbi:hypothetical protein L1987_57385 [Smallanthus sonchifolius]|uniref:Uncharacterized protein n=1 Tax=Smallanthus sonchifolius TaxID=185202 RepID=A0ACB9DCJ1_9ASTR|nr:hypothetical protein L1987_57385 [Smallanthus sonchifolius]
MSSLVPIVGGLALASFTEASFNWIGFGSAMASNVTNLSCNKMAKILNDSSLNFKYSTIEKATGSWDEANKLGQGGFGTVYRCVDYSFKL